MTRRHIAGWFEARTDEQHALMQGLTIAKAKIFERFNTSDFNIGINVGPMAGQTVPHLHVHLIPRYPGDVDDPRGGVRHVIPGRGNYLATTSTSTGQSNDSLDVGSATDSNTQIADSQRSSYTATAPRLVGLDTRPFIDHILRDLATAGAANIAVAFVTCRGLDRMLPHMEDLLRRGGSLRVLTGDYLDVTEPDALRRLLYLDHDHSGNIERRVFECTNEIGFHPKAYLLRGPDGQGSAYIGSSNMTTQGLAGSVEWNFRVDPWRDANGFAEITKEFEALFHHRQTRPLTLEWIGRYEQKRRVPATLDFPRGIEAPAMSPQPHAIQQAALIALRKTREAGNRAGLVVLATGLGKTWLAAFDSRTFPRVLFVAHREEILAQALRTFQQIRPNAKLGRYSGAEKNVDAEVVFASVQTIARSRHLARFDERAFDYIVVDEFHHASAKTYRRLLDHFTPDFLLGLTATPERTDGGDLLALCGENLVFRCDLVTGIENGLLCPFHYHGIPDDLEYANIPWRNGRFDERALESAVATQARARNAFEQWKVLKGSRTLAFCVSQRHAEFMTEFFARQGVLCACVHSGATSDPRAMSLEALHSGEIQVVFSVDMFNEGVDVPSVDTVLLLRPTESKLVWLQLFGRGLRIFHDKSSLTVIDYVGNHHSFLKVPMLLFADVGESPAQILMGLERYRRGEIELPPGCSVTYKLGAVDILEALARSRIRPGIDELQIWYEDFRQQNDVRPTALESWHAGHDPRSVRREHRSWFGFVSDLGDLDAEHQQAYASAGKFLRELETTMMNKSYKMLVLLAMIAEEAFPGTISLERLAASVGRRARPTGALISELGRYLDDPTALSRMLVVNPIRAWTGKASMGGVSYFTFERGNFQSRIDCPTEASVALRDMTREICEWRLGQYLDRGAKPPA